MQWFLHILVVSWIAAPAFVDEATLVREVRSALRAQNWPRALNLLEQFGPEQENLSWALAEAGRIYYRQSRWNEFFGVAGYSRKVYPFGRHADDLRALEALAFVRHCHGDLARQILLERMSLADHRVSQRLQQVADLLEVSTSPTLKSFSTPESQPLRHPGGALAMGWWPANDISIERLNPFRFRRHIEPLCSTETSSSTEGVDVQ